MPVSTYRRPHIETSEKHIETSETSYRKKKKFILFQFFNQHQPNGKKIITN